MNNEPKKYNDIIYGEAKIIAVDMNKWRLPCGSTTTSHVRARNAAIKMNRMMGGKATAAQRMSAGVK
jgi:hypothetical protein